MATEAPPKQGNLTQKEWSLIAELRKYRFSEFRIEMKDGQPHRLYRGVEDVLL